MAKLNRICIVCSKNYEYCNSCKEHAMLEPWHSIFHDNNCREIFNAVSMYGKDSNEVIKAKLDKCDLSNKDNFHKNIIKVIDEIYASEKTIEIVKEEPVVEVVEENTTEVTESVEDTVKTGVIEEETKVATRSRKRK